jgi:hypothetical protein
MFQIQQCHDVFVDSCVRNESGALLFLSAFGRDTALKELMARIQLSDSSQDGLSDLKLKGFGVHAGENHTVFIDHARDLQKTSGRLSKCLYGQLNHLWIYVPALLDINKATGIAWVLVRQTRSPDGTVDALDREDLSWRLWRAVVELSTIPLMAHWRTTVFQAMQDDLVLEMGSAVKDDPRLKFARPIGDVLAFKVHLAEDFPERISQLIRQGKLTLEKPRCVDLLAMG